MALGVLICGEKIVIERKGKPVNGESHFRFQSMIEGAINVFLVRCYCFGIESVFSNAVGRS